jgi:hypothetical protein
LTKNKGFFREAHIEVRVDFLRSCDSFRIMQKVLKKSMQEEEGHMIREKHETAKIKIR